MKGKGILITIVILIIILLVLVGFYLYHVFIIKEKEENVTLSNQQENIQVEEQELPKQQVSTSSFQLTKEEYPKVDGATAMKPMSVQIAAQVMGISVAEAEGLIIHNTTKQAYENIINKKADLIFVSEPSNDILKQAEEKNVELEMVGIGRDGFVFLVNKQNPVNNLTIRQIQDIYTGAITNWKEVGGNDSPIIAYQREKNSGSQNLMEKLVMKDKPLMEPIKAQEITAMGDLIDAIADYDNSENAIGYSIYLYAKEQYVKDNIKFLKIDSVVPTDDTIANGTYPLSKIVYAVFRKEEPQDSNVRKLVNWLKTPEGQQVVEKGGYVGLQ